MPLLFPAPTNPSAPAAVGRSPRRTNTYAWSVLLRGAGALGGRALATVGAENSYFNATVLLPVVSGLFIVHRLVFAESDDLNAVHGHIVLRHKISLHGLSAATAQLQIVLGGASLVGEALNGHEIALHASDFGAANLIELLLGIVRKLRRIELKEHHDVTRGLVIVDVGD